MRGWPQRVMKIAFVLAVCFSALVTTFGLVAAPYNTFQEPLPSPAKFTGEVFHGQSFEREFGSSLLFRLRPSIDPQTPGWTIEIRPKLENNAELEYSWPVTPPYRF